MRIRRKHNWPRLVIELFVILAVVIPTPACADGGIITDDVQIWEQIEEGEQIAVVHLSEEDTAQVDLFVSLHDASGTSHEIEFFVPLGSQPTGFDVVEEGLADFQTAQLDLLNKRLQDAARDTMKYQEKVRKSLLWPGSLLAPGAGGFGAALFLIVEGTGIFDSIVGGVGEVIEPVTTLQTEHARVEVYELEDDTNLEALIATTGLHPAVQDTLRRFEQQQVAVITLQTQPGSEQGLRLSWASPLTGDREAMYAYPLGTGSAWARPIELTSVYVVSSPGVDFRVAYPRLGKNRSGYVRTIEYAARHFSPLIMQHADTPNYAVEQAVETASLATYGRVWRVTYTQSNAAEDIVITRIEGLHLGTKLRLFVQEVAGRHTWVIGLLAALAIWMAAWRFVMPRRLGFPFQWARAVIWTCIYNVVGTLVITVTVVMTLMLGPLSSLWNIPWEAELLARALALNLPVGIVNSYLSSRAWNIPWKETAKAYALLIVTSTVAYGLFALVYLALVGGL